MTCHRVGTQPIRIPVRKAEYNLVCACCGVLGPVTRNTSRKMKHQCGAEVIVRRNLLTSSHGRRMIES